MKMLLSGEGVKAAHSFLSLGRRPVLGQCGIPEGGQTCIDLFAQQQGIGLLIEGLQPLLLLWTQHSCGQETLIGRLGFIPFAPHLVAFHRFVREMHHRLEHIVVEPHPLIERVTCRDLLRSIQAQFAEILPHQGVIFLLHVAVIIFLVRTAARELDPSHPLFPEPHQVLSNQESLRLQYALQQRALELGWRPEDIEIIDADLGLTATSASHRAGFQELVAKVTLGQVGLILSVDVMRLSRNCSDWYPLLDVCGYRGCLIADRDGIYDPGSANGRLLLGLKGQLSELELHTIRARMTAGLLNKAQRGELALTLPIGLVRDAIGKVHKDPNREIQDRLALGFSTFLRLRSANNESCAGGAPPHMKLILPYPNFRGKSCSS